MNKKQKRALTVFSLLAVAACAAALILSALNDNIVFFLSPTELSAKTIASGQRLRLGGMVEQGSLKREGRAVRFIVTDGKQKLDVTYEGPLPDLFREEQGVVAEGQLRDGVFAADMILAKHDENYMPREVADALKKQGYWQMQAPPPGAGK